LPTLSIFFKESIPCFINPYSFLFLDSISLILYQILIL
jgi:hypothetical protein